VSAVKLYVDEDASENAVMSALRRHGIDVLTAADAGHERHSDEDQLVFAASVGRTIYSLNLRHFARLHQQFLARREEHACIILIPRQRYGIGEMSRRLRQLLDSTTAETMKNSIHFL
jgi:hypothetical protein